MDAVDRMNRCFLDAVEACITMAVVSGCYSRARLGQLTATAINVRLELA